VGVIYDTAVRPSDDVRRVRLTWSASSIDS
jgi:hypothetical protein